MSGCSWNHSFTIHWGAGVIHRALAVGVSFPLHPESRKDRVKSSYRLHKHFPQADQSLASSEPRPAKYNRASRPQRCAMWLEPYNAGREKSVKISIHNLVCLDSHFELINFVDCCPIALGNSILTGGGSVTGGSVTGVSTTGPHCRQLATAARDHAQRETVRWTPQ